MPKTREDRLRLAALRTRLRRLDSVDEQVGTSSTSEKQQRLDLGLALMQVYANPTMEYTRQEIATWCGCSDERIRQIEVEALKKLRFRLREVSREG